MTTPPAYAPLTVESLPKRLAGVAALTGRVGPDPAAWRVEEVGDGNLNLVFIVRGPAGAVIVKQALPYVRLVGDSWPLPLSRAFFEQHALTRQAARAPGSVPALYHFDEAQALIVMEYLAGHQILRHRLIAGERVAGLASALGQFCARTAFRGSELSMESAAKKADVALFSGNGALAAITEALVFTDPYCDAPLNNHTPGLEPVIATLRSDPMLKVRVQTALSRFASAGETMLHGDLHTGSIMVTETAARIIDPEFVQYGPLGFDLGMLMANFLMAYFSQPAHRGDGAEAYQDWILSVVEETCAAFEDEFRALWQSERTGMLYPRRLFEDQGQSSAPACEAVLAQTRHDAWTTAGIEMHRRCLSLAHNADFEEIADPALRAPLEARNLMMGVSLIHLAAETPDAAAVTAMARRYHGKDVL